MACSPCIVTVVEAECNGPGDAGANAVPLGNGLRARRPKKVEPVRAGNGPAPVCEEGAGLAEPRSQAALARISAWPGGVGGSDESGQGPKTEAAARSGRLESVSGCRCQRSRDGSKAQALIIHAFAAAITRTRGHVPVESTSNRTGRNCSITPMFVVACSVISVQVKDDAPPRSTTASASSNIH